MGKFLLALGVGGQTQLGIRISYIPGEVDPDILGWLSSESDSDHVSVTSSEVHVEGFTGKGIYWADDMDYVDMGEGAAGNGEI